MDASYAFGVLQIDVLFVQTFSSRYSCRLFCSSTVPNHRQLIFRKATHLSPSSLLSTIALAWFSWSDFMSCCIALFCMPYQMFMLRLYMCLIGCHLTLSMSDLYALNCLLFFWFLIWSAFLGHWPSFGQHCLVLSSCLCFVVILCAVLICIFWTACLDFDDRLSPQAASLLI